MTRTVLPSTPWCARRAASAACTITPMPGCSTACSTAARVWSATTGSTTARGPGFAELRLASVTTGARGKVDLVPPHAIHAEQGGPARSVAIILRSQRLGEGTVLQHAYDPAARTVSERWGPTQIPYDISGGA